MRIKGFTPATLAVWLRATPENVDAIATLVASGDLRFAEYPGGGETVLRTHNRDITKLEIGEAPVLPETSD
jgi:hypothetical protein